MQISRAKASEASETARLCRLRHWGNLSYAMITVFVCMLVSAGKAQQRPQATGPADTTNAAAEEKNPGVIGLSAERIPIPPTSLHVLRLSSQKPPIEFLQETLLRSDPTIKK